MTCAQKSRLRKRIDALDYLTIIDEASEDGGLLVLDERGASCAVIDSDESLNFLVAEGVDAWLNSEFNGVFVR